MKECIVRSSGGKYHICGYKPVTHLVEVDDFIIRFGRKFKYYVEVKKHLRNERG